MRATGSGNSKTQQPWLQLSFVLGEAVLSLIANGVLYVIISRASGSELLGAYALATAWLALFQGVSSFGVPEFIMREVGAHGRSAAPQVVHSMAIGLASGGAALLLMLGVVRVMGYPPDIARSISVGSLALLPAFLSTACRSVFLARREMHLTLLALGTEVSILMTSSLALLLSGHGATALMTSFVVAKIASAVVSMALLFRTILGARPSLDPKLLARTAKIVFSFGVGNMLGMLTMRISVIMASAWVGIAAVGHLAAATKVMEVGLIAPNLFVQLLMTRIAYSFSAHGERDPNRFAAWYQILFALMTPACVGGFIFAQLILETLFGSGFGEARWILRVLMIYLLIESGDAVMSVILKAANKQEEDMSRFAFNPVVNILLNFALLPLLGTLGAALSRVGGAVASTTLRHILVSERLARIEWLRLLWKPAAISIGAGAACAAAFDVDRSFLALTLYVLLSMLLTALLSGFSIHAVKDMVSVPPSRD